MRLPIFLNGLIPNTRDLRNGKGGGSRVYIQIEKPGIETIKKRETADNEGKVEFVVSDYYAGGEILVRIRHRWYCGIEAHDTIPDYGFFYTAKIQHDFSFWTDSPSSDPEWKSEDEYLRASAEKNEKLRHHRYKNRLIKVVYYAVSILAPFVGLILGGVPGVGVGLLIFALLQILAPYSIGLKKSRNW